MVGHVREIEAPRTTTVENVQPRCANMTEKGLADLVVVS